MKTNREIDALVAEHVMGLQPCSDPIGRCDAAKMTPCQCWGTPDRFGVVSGGELASYHTDIAAAWLVVEKLAQDGDEHPVCIQKGLPAFGDHATPFEVYKNYAGYPGWTCYFADYEVCAHADTAPLAICLAALKAVGVEVEKSKNAT